MLVMQDSIFPQNLTAGADAYLGYVNGSWPTYHTLVSMFPHSHIVSIAVTAAYDAEGCDYERWDLTEGQVPGWIKRQLTRGVWRPIIYASVSSMGALIPYLAAQGIPRSKVRLLTAHYGAGQHICGPATCRYPGVPACDGTQWTDAGAGAHGAKIDLSLLLAEFFAVAPTPPAPKPPVEDSMPSGSLIVLPPIPGVSTTAFGAVASVPLPAGCKKVTLFCDHISATRPLGVRVAVYSASKGYSQIATPKLTDAKPVELTFTEKDVTAVSLQRTDSQEIMIVGYLIA